MFHHGVVNADPVQRLVLAAQDALAVRGVPRLGDTLRVRLPGGTITSGKVFFKSAEADFATQRDVNRRKRDIKTIVLKIRLDNPKGAFVPGMTAEVLVSPDQINGQSKPPKTAEAGQR